MDLMRVAKTALNINVPFETETATLFLDKAKTEFNSHLATEKVLKNELEHYQSKIADIKDSKSERLKWGEKIMTIASRLGCL